MTYYYFAWVDPTDTTFSPSFERYDENVFSLRREHLEGNIPSLQIEIRNPRIGLLHAGRKVWAWLSWRSPSGTVKPLFFGRLVGVPTNMFAEFVTLQFIAKPVDYVKQKQTTAETMKVRPYWDPVFLDPQKRDDPDSILEGWAKLWHVDPVTLKVTASSIIDGEDGNVVFTGHGDALYDNVSTKMNQSPLVAVQVDATVSWEQTAVGTVDMGTRLTFTYTGDGLLKEWPKPLAQLGGGWSVQYSRATDILSTGFAVSGSTTMSWKNNDTVHHDGDTMSANLSATFPSQDGIRTTLTSLGRVSSLEAPQNISLSETYMYALEWQIGTSLTLRYDARRQRTDRLIFMLTADVQQIITSPLVTQDTELITRQGCDVGVPIFNVLNWTSVSGHAVAVGDVVFPDNPLLPGGVSGQICVVAGVAGAVEPVFSDVSGVETVDNTATWASLGHTSVGSSSDWSAETPTPVGAIILPTQPFFATWTTVTQDGFVAFPKVGASISQGQIVRASNGSFQVCFLPGITGLVEPSFSATWGVDTIDGSVTWISLGMSLPTGTNYFVCTTAGTTGPILQTPSFDNTLHGKTVDGTVTWTCIGSGDIPVGGFPTQVHGRSYFPTDRGLWSVEYLISVARAKLLMRSRAVEVTWDCPFEKAIDLTCRKTATLIDHRFPGGQATGKIISCSIESDDKGVQFGKVTVACAVGNGGSVTVSTGTPLYGTEGYWDVGEYQAYGTDRVVSVSGVDLDVGYSPPLDAPNDDGITFPIFNKSQIVVTEEWRGSLDDQVVAVGKGLANAKKAAQFALGHQTPLTKELAFEVPRQMAMASVYSVGFFLSQNPIWYDLELKPVTNGPFLNEYAVSVTQLNIPKMIDLGAASS